MRIARHRTCSMISIPFGPCPHYGGLRQNRDVGQTLLPPPPGPPRSASPGLFQKALPWPYALAVYHLCPAQSGDDDRAGIRAVGRGCPVRGVITGRGCYHAVNTLLERAASGRCAPLFLKSAVRCRCSSLQKMRMRGRRQAADSGRGIRDVRPDPHACRGDIRKFKPHRGDSFWAGLRPARTGEPKLPPEAARAGGLRFASPKSFDRDGVSR